MNQKPYGEEPRAPKPYDFVPFPNQVKSIDSPGHDCLDLPEHYCGRIVYTFKTLTPLFIGTAPMRWGRM
jgi:hypothetical protein